MTQRAGVRTMIFMDFSQLGTFAERGGLAPLVLIKIPALALNNEATASDSNSSTAAATCANVKPASESGKVFASTS